MANTLCAKELHDCYLVENNNQVGEGVWIKSKFIPVRLAC